ASHDLGDALGMFGEDAGNQPATRGRDGSNDKTLVPALLASPNQTAFLQVVHHQGQVAAAGEDSAGKIAQVQRPYVIQGFKYRELSQAQSSLFQPHPGIGYNGISSPRQLDIRAQGALFRGTSFEVSSHNWTLVWTALKYIK